VVRAADGSPVSIDERLTMSGPPAQVAVGREPGSEVTSWAGPWPVEERWWAPAEARQVCRLQVCLTDGRALLLALSSDTWTVEASYD
jgi:protein ImuB